MPGPLRTHISPASRLPLPAARLRLTAFELLMWLDDRPGYPMVFAVECRLAGRFEPERLAAAWDQVTAINPILSARVVLDRGKPYWTAGSSGPLLEWMSAGWQVSETPVIDLRTSPGCRGEVHETADETRLVLYFHHASSDGLGAIIFVGDLLAAYHRACCPEDADAELREVDSGLLLHRGRGPEPPRLPAPGDPAPPSGWRATLGLLTESARFAAAKVAPLAKPGQGPAATAEPATAAGDRDAGSLRPFVTLRLPAAETGRLRTVAAAAEATVNDVLLAAFFRTLTAWNAARGPVRKQALCRLTMPVNLRNAEDKRMPTCNAMGYAFLERPMSRCGQPDLLASIRDESKRVKTSGSSVREFMGAIDLAASSPWAFDLGLRAVGTFSTAVISNLSDPTRRFASRLKRRGGRVVSGDLELLEIVAAPPVRPGTRASLAILQNEGRLSFCLLADSRLFTRAQALSLLDSFAAELAHEGRP